MQRGSQFNRREMLKRSAHMAGAAALPTILPTSVFGKDGASPPSDRIVVGCIGVGRQGTADMKQFLSKPEARVVATCDVNKMNLAWATELVNAKYGNRDCKEYTDFRELLAHDDIDAVLIATPQHWHVPIAIAAAKAGKDMYCEKPLSMAMTWNWELQKVIRRYNVVFQFGTQQRSDAHFQHACKLVRDGNLGKITDIKIWCPNRNTLNLPLRKERVPEWLDHEMWLGPALWAPYGERPDTGVRSDRSLGMISEWGVHMLDIIHMAGQHQPETGLEIEGAGQWSTGGGWDDCPIDYDIKMRYGNGMTVEFKSESILPGFWKSRYLKDPNRERVWGHGIVFEGTKGWVHVDRESINASPAKLIEKPIEGAQASSGSLHVQNFLDCVKSRKDPVAGIDGAVEADLLSHLSYIAVETGQQLKWDAKSRRFSNDEMANRMLTRSLRSPWHI